MTDEERRSFLDDLDDAAIDVSDWEAGFLDSTMGQETFSPKQRDVVDGMCDKYEDRI